MKEQPGAVFEKEGAGRGRHWHRVWCQAQKKIAVSLCSSHAILLALIFRCSTPPPPSAAAGTNPQQAHIPISAPADGKDHVTSTFFISVVAALVVCVCVCGNSRIAHLIPTPPPLAFLRPLSLRKFVHSLSALHGIWTSLAESFSLHRQLDRSLLHTDTNTRTKESLKPFRSERRSTTYTKRNDYTERLRSYHACSAR